jgi:hypothetical protein
MTEIKRKTKLLRKELYDIFWYKKNLEYSLCSLKVSHIDNYIWLNCCGEIYSSILLEIREYENIY